MIVVDMTDWDVWGWLAQRDVWLSEVLKISVRTSVSCSAQSFSTRPGMLSGPAALRGLQPSVFLTSAGDRQSTWSLEVWAVFVQVCHSAFQTVSKSGWVHLGGMCRHHRPVAGAYSQWWSEWLATGSVCLLSVKWLLIFLSIWPFRIFRMPQDRLALAVLRAALSPDLKSSSQVFSSPWTSAVIHGFWFARVVMVLVTVTSSMHFLI